jgi:hypothetical protein
MKTSGTIFLGHSNNSKYTITKSSWREYLTLWTCDGVREVGPGVTKSVDWPETFGWLHALWKGNPLPTSPGPSLWTLEARETQRIENKKPSNRACNLEAFCAIPAQDGAEEKRGEQELQSEDSRDQPLSSPSLH